MVCTVVIALAFLFEMLLILVHTYRGTIGYECSPKGIASNFYSIWPLPCFTPVPADGLICTDFC